METTLMDNVTAVDVLKKDHEVIRELFRQFDKAGNDHRKKVIGDRCIREIETHRIVEEKVFYPAVRRDLGEQKLVAQAINEQTAAQRLVNELKDLAQGELYNARFRALKEKYTSHIDREEAGMLTLVERSDMDIEQLGAQLIERKLRVESNPLRRVDARKVAAIAAGVAVVGGAAFLIRRLAADRRSR